MTGAGEIRAGDRGMDPGLHPGRDRWQETGAP